jgi:hypothetical protein
LRATVPLRARLNPPANSCLDRRRPAELAPRPPSSLLRWRAGCARRCDSFFPNLIYGDMR